MLSLVDSTGYGCLPEPPAERQNRAQICVVRSKDGSLIVISLGAALTCRGKDGKILSLLEWVADRRRELENLISIHYQGEANLSKMPVKVSFVPLRESLATDHDEKEIWSFK